MHRSMYRHVHAHTHIHAYQGSKAIARRHVNDQQHSLLPFWGCCFRHCKVTVTLPPTVPGYLISNLAHERPLASVESFPSKRIFLRLSWYSFLRQLMNEEIGYLNSSARLFSLLLLARIKFLFKNALRSFGEVFVCLVFNSQTSRAQKISWHEEKPVIAPSFAGEFLIPKTEAFLPIISSLHSHSAVFTRCLLGLSGARCSADALQTIRSISSQHGDVHWNTRNFRSSCRLYIEKLFYNKNKHCSIMPSWNLILYRRNWKIKFLNLKNI